MRVSVVLVLGRKCSTTYHRGHGQWQAMRWYGALPLLLAANAPSNLCTRGGMVLFPFPLVVPTVCNPTAALLTCAEKRRSCFTHCTMDSATDPRLLPCNSTPHLCGEATVVPTMHFAACHDLLAITLSMCHQRGDRVHGQYTPMISLLSRYATFHQP
jgi:hypothetical protein